MPLKSYRLSVEVLIEKSNQLFSGNQSFEINYSQYEWHFEPCSTYEESNALFKSRFFVIWILTRQNQSLEVLLNETKLAVLGKSDFGYRQKVNINCTLLHFCPIRNPISTSISQFYVLNAFLEVEVVNFDIAKKQLVVLLENFLVKEKNVCLLPFFRLKSLAKKMFQVRTVVCITEYDAKSRGRSKKNKKI